MAHVNPAAIAFRDRLHVSEVRSRIDMKENVGPRDRRQVIQPFYERKVKNDEIRIVDSSAHPNSYREGARASGRSKMPNHERIGEGLRRPRFATYQKVKRKEARDGISVSWRHSV